MFLYSLLALAVVTALIFAAPLKAKVWATLAVVAAGGRHRPRRGSHDRSTVDSDLVGDPVSDRQCNPDRPVGRMDRITFFTGSGSNA